MTVNRLAQAIGVGRLAFGAFAFVAPVQFAEQSKLPGAGAAADARYVTRLFGGRDIVIGALQINPASSATATDIGVACDALDCLSGLLAQRDGWSRGNVSSVIAAAFVALGVLARKT